MHGPFVDDGEVESVANFLRQQGEPEYDDRVVEEVEAGIDLTDVISQGTANGGSLYEQAVALVVREQKASTSFVQRHLKIGYNRAATIIEEMESSGIISAANHVGKRDVLITNDEKGSPNGSCNPKKLLFSSKVINNRRALRVGFGLCFYLCRVCMCN